MVRLPWQITRQMFLSEDEVDALLAHISRRVRQAGPEDVTARVDEVIIRALLFSGLRNSEFCGLTLAHGDRRRASLFQVGTRVKIDVYVPGERESDPLSSKRLPAVSPRGASPPDLPCLSS
jgi:integrase